MTLRTFEHWLWYLFVATAAWQTRIILWQADRTFVEWRSMSIYLSDVLMLALFVCALLDMRVAKGETFLKPKRFHLLLEHMLLGLFILLAAFSLFDAGQLTVGLYQLARLVQFIVFYFYLRQWALRKFDRSATAAAFVLGALVQAGLGIAQYALQHDVGLRWLGETLLRTDMQGVAVFFDAGAHKILRAYGTLPHPNMLAAYLMLALWATAWLWQKVESKKSKVESIVWAATFSVLLVAFYLTFSRTMIAAWLAASAVVAALQWRHVRHIVVLTLAVSALFAVILWPQVEARLLVSTSDEAVQVRLDYAHDSLASGGGSFLHINWFGVGIGNFTTWLAHAQPKLPAYYLQPAHDLYLLVYSEVGFFGMLVLLAWLALLVRHSIRARNTFGIILAAMLFIALFDHFFWTLQQGRILWWATLALAAGTEK